MFSETFFGPTKKAKHVYNLTLDRGCFHACILSTVVKPVYNDHPWDPNKVAIVDKLNGTCSEFIRVIKVRWSLYGGGRLLKFYCRLKEQG